MRAKDKKRLKNLKNIKIAYSAYTIDELTLLKAEEEAHEEDSKQLALFLLGIGVVISFGNTGVAYLLKKNAESNQLSILMIVLVLIIFVLGLWVIKSVTDTRLTRRKKVIEIVLAEKKAARESLQSPTIPPKLR